MNRKFRLTRTEDFKRVRRLGKSHAHPLLVLISAPNEMAVTRFGVVAGTGVGGAVQRNRLKRWLRSAVRALLPGVLPGWDVILIARKNLGESSFQQAAAALRSLMQRAGLLAEENGSA